MVTVVCLLELCGGCVFVGVMRLLCASGGCCVVVVVFVV